MSDLTSTIATFFLEEIVALDEQIAYHMAQALELERKKRIIKRLEARLAAKEVVKRKTSIIHHVNTPTSVAEIVLQLVEKEGEISLVDAVEKVTKAFPELNPNTVRNAAGWLKKQKKIEVLRTGEAMNKKLLRSRKSPKPSLAPLDWLD